MKTFQFTIIISLLLLLACKNEQPTPIETIAENTARTSDTVPVIEEKSDLTSAPKDTLTKTASIPAPSKETPKKSIKNPNSTSITSQKSKPLSSPSNKEVVSNVEKAENIADIATNEEEKIKAAKEIAMEKAIADKVKKEMERAAKPLFEQPKSNADNGPGIEEPVDYPRMYATLLSEVVDARGTVNYKALLAKKESLKMIIEHYNTAYIPRTKAAKLAFWMNAYNAFTLYKIIQNYPLSSIMKLDNGKTWDVKDCKIVNKMYSLNNIENDILRAELKEPLIHFGVNCAAKSCPPLSQKMYDEDNVMQQLNINTRQFVNNRKYNQISPTEIKVSKIFEWYAADFPNLIEFLNQHSKVKIKPDAKVSYLEYDWQLN